MSGLNLLLVEALKADIHTITGVLKKFLMELPDPLIPEKFSTRLEQIEYNAMTGEERKVAIIQALLHLPKANQGIFLKFYTFVGYDSV